MSMSIAEPMAEVAVAPGPVRQPGRKPGWTHAVLLLGIYVLVGLFMDPAGYLSTDVGGKTASLEAMVQRGDWDPDIGYWFEQADPEGAFFPFADTFLTANDQWVNTTTLTMIYPMRVLWELGGARAALLIPMAGAVVVAAAAAALERRLKPAHNGQLSFWLVGLATPVTVYAMDLWEHTLGLAAMAVAVVAVFDATKESSSAPLRASIVAGLGFGFAATMRQEALVYGLFAGLFLVIELARRKRLRAAVTGGVAMATATVAMLAAHLLAEVVILGEPVRLLRGGGSIAIAGTGLSDRLRSIAAIILFPFNGDHPLSYVVGAALLLSIAAVTRNAIKGRPSKAAPAVLVLCVIFCAAFYYVMGPRFVPGLVPTTPLAAAGLVIAAGRRDAFILSLAVLPLPLLFVLHFPEGAIPQWGGRYLLLTGFMLAVAAIAYLSERHSTLLRGLAACGIAITLFGLVWTGVRKDGVTDDWEALAAVTEPADIVVWGNPIYPREAGVEQYGKKWLSAREATDQIELASVLRSLDVDTFVFVEKTDEDDIPRFIGFERLGQLNTMDFLGLRIVQYGRS